MSLVQSLGISRSAPQTERLRMDVVANNLANVNSTRTEEGGPYKRQTVLVRDGFAVTQGWAATVALLGRDGALVASITIGMEPHMIAAARDKLYAVDAGANEAVEIDPVARVVTRRARGRYTGGARGQPRRAHARRRQQPLERPVVD